MPTTSVADRMRAVRGLTFLNAIAIGLILQVRHAGEEEANEINPVLHALRDIALSVPMFVVAIVVGLEVAGVAVRRGRLEGTVTGDVARALAVTIAESVALVFGGLFHEAAFTTVGADIHHALSDSLSMLPYTLTAAVVSVSLVRIPSNLRALDLPLGVALSTERMIRRWIDKAGRIDGRRLVRALTAVAVVAGGLSINPIGDSNGLVDPAEALSPPRATTCDSSSVDRTYDISAINVVIPRNRWADVDLNGQVYALDQDKAAIRYWAEPLADNPADDPSGNRRLRPRPLVLRANEGECMRISLTNELDVEAPVPPGSPFAYQQVTLPGDLLPANQWVTIHAHGVSYNPQTSGGGAVGFNDDTGIPPGGNDVYYWRVPADEGAFLFRDTSTLAGSEADSGSTGHGLYGVLAVEPAGSQWFDPETGQRLDGARPYQNVSDKSGELYLDAIIVPPLAQGNSYTIDSNNLQVREPDSVAFRETMQISQDEMPGQHLQNCDLAAADNGLMIDGRPDRSTCISTHPLGNNVPTKNSLQSSIGLGFNYGEENLLLRQHPINRCADCVGEETWLSSWPYGDPALVKLASGFGPWYPTWHPWYDGGADGINANAGQQNLDNPDDPEDCGLANGCYTANVPHAYQYDAQKIRFIHAGPKETHVFHMHAHQWLTDSKDVGASGSTPGVPDDDKLPESTTIDSQSFGPGESFTADLLFGAGSRPGTVGDSIFHCHLYPHFAEGFWSLFRTHDVYEDGTGTTPDRLRVRRILPLPDRAQTPDDPTAGDPGYPRFLPGEYGWRAPQPLNGISEPNGLIDDPSTVAREDLSPATRLVAGVGLEQPTQELSITDATGGDFKLTFGSETTGNIQWNADPASIEAALVALNGIKNAIVTQSGGPGTPYQIEFGELEVDPDVSPRVVTVLLDADGTGLSGLTPDIGVTPPAWVDYPDGLLLDQEIDLGGTTGGTFALTLAGETTSDIAWNAATSTVETALESLTGVLAATVSSGAPSGVDYVVIIDQVASTFAASSVLLSIDYALLTASAIASVSNTTWPTPSDGIGLDQDVDLGGATGGTFNLSVDGDTTTDIAWNASPATVQTAIEALPGVVAATVSPGGLTGPDYVVTVDQTANSFAAVSVLLSIDDSLLTASATASASKSTWGPPHGGQLPYQEIDLINAAGGTFKLIFEADMTTDIVWNAATTAVETAVEALTGVVDATVSLGAAPGAEYVITINEFVSAPTTGDPGLSADPTGLTAPAPSATVSASWSGAGEAQATNVAYRLSLETAATHESHNDGIFDDASGNNEPKPGAPLVDPCPAGSREITYNVSMIQLNIEYNSAGWHDTQGRVLVLDSDVDDVLAGRKPIEPFFFRANPNDCVNFNLTNRAPNWVGNDDFLRLIQTNMIGQHIHLVKFDVTASDGASNGWNYQEAAFSRAQRLFDDSVLTGDYIADEPDLAHMPKNADGKYLPAACGTDTFDGADLVTDGCRIPSPTSFNPQWTCTLAGGCPQGQTISERWYVDYELKTIFTHDHHFPAEDQNRGLFGAMVVEPAEMDVRDPTSGEYLQPINDPSHGTVCGTECNANSVGTRLDVIGPGPSDDFREFALAIQDFVSLYRPCTGPGGTCPAPGEFAIAGEEPVAPPDAPEEFPLDDPGVMGINYRTEPFVIRDIASGAAADPAYVFSSTVHGDPATPLLKAYAGDNMRARVIQGSQEEQHVLQVHGMRWLDEPDDPESGLTNAKSIGISEAFNFEISNVNCGNGRDCFGDYLYGGTSTDDMWTGAWGLLRIFGQQVNDLLPLPDNAPPTTYPDGPTPDLRQTGNRPLNASNPGNPCQTGSPVRSFHVIALDTPIVYDDEAGQFDPFGLVYAALLPGETPAQGAARVRASNPEPMVIRATEGDCIEVTLTNMIDPEGAFAIDHAPVGSAEAPNGYDPALVIESPDGTPAGLRVSLHAALVDYDPLGSDGATIGYNPDQTVGPRQLTDPSGSEGESILYRWYAPVVDPGELGSINLTDYGDVRGHRHHGLFAGLVIEPSGATWTDPITGDGDTFSPQADIHVPGNNDFREFVTFYQDGLNLWDADGHLPDPLDHGGEGDAEDRGEKGLNYRTEAFQQRLGLVPGAPIDHAPGTPSVHAAGGTVINIEGSDLAHVFSSWPYGDRPIGDPDTPVFRAYAGDDIRWRVLQGADKPRQHTFSIAGHSWFRQPNEEAANVETVGAQGALSVGRALNIETTAGGTTASPGDYRYGDVLLSNSLSGGWWGLLRVYEPPPSEAGITPLDDPDNPHTRGYSPLQLLNISSNPVSNVSTTSGGSQQSATAGGSSGGITGDGQTTSGANTGGGQQPSTPVKVLPAVEFAPDPKIPFDLVPSPAESGPAPVEPRSGVSPSVAVAPPAVAFVGAPTFTG